MTATFVFIKSGNPVSSCKIPNVPALEAQPCRADQRDRSHRGRPAQPRAEGKIVQIMQKRQHDKRMQTKLVSQHAFHIDASDARDGEEIQDEGCKIKYDAHRTIGWTLPREKKFGGKHSEQY